MGEFFELRRLYTEKQKPFLDQRAKVLQGNQDDGVQTGTAACPKFWLEAMRNHPALEEHIQDWDMDVLSYLKDITSTFVEDDATENSNSEEITMQGPPGLSFKLSFFFKENPFFENAVLEKEYRVIEESPYCRGDCTPDTIMATEIMWKQGQNVTVEKTVAKKAKGGAKKGKPKKTKEEPRNSFFRLFFRNLKAGDQIPADLKKLRLQNLDSDFEDDDLDDVEMNETFMNEDHEVEVAKFTVLFRKKGRNIAKPETSVDHFLCGLRCPCSKCLVPFLGTRILLAAVVFSVSSFSAGWACDKGRDLPLRGAVVHW